MNEEKWEEVFTPDIVEKMSYIWTRSSISLIDVRHQSICPDQPLQQYKMLSNTLVYAYGGTGHVQLNEAVFAMERFGVFHGGKGTMLSILPEETPLKSYMVLYKAETPTFFKKDLQRLLEQVNPFLLQFSYAPSNPVGLIHLFEQMMGSWRGSTSLNHFQTKNLFNQSMYEIYKDLEQEQAMFLRPDPVLSVKRYLDEYYMQPIMFQDIADMFAISSGQLTRLFKKREGVSLQEYAIQKRLRATLFQLENTNASVKEIALGCGFANERNFFRMFKKHFKVTPIEYRKIKRQPMHEYTIDNDYHRLYNEMGLGDLAKFQKDGEFTMFGQIRSKHMLLAAAMSLMLLLTACSSNSVINSGNGNNSTPTPASTSTSTEQTPAASEVAEPQTRVVKTSHGEVEVPADPKRVVVQYLMGDVIAMGVIPVGISDVYEGAAFADLVQDSESLGWFPDWEAESVMQLEPDLILVIDEEYVSKYSKIAPTVNIPFGDMTQNERITFIGEVLNRQAEAAQVIEEFDANLSEQKNQLAQAGFDTYTVSVFEAATDTAMLVHGSKHGVGSMVYVSLGLKAPETIQTRIIDKDTFNEELSFEVLPEYSGDFIVRNVYDGMTDLSNHTIWNALSAVQNNRVIDMEFGFGYYSDVYSSMAQINYVAQSLLQASK